MLRKAVCRIRQLILASSSPRRKQLLEGLGLRFVIHPSDEEESIPAADAPSDIVQALSLAKASRVASQFDSGLVIGADTIVVCDDEVLGKPANEQAAFSMLSKLQGRSHYVYTGVAIADAGTGATMVAHNRTEVFMKAMSESRIRQYIATGEPEDKAGAYGIQGFGATIVERIDGDYFTVVGLPLGLLSDMLESFGVRVF